VLLAIETSAVETGLALVDGTTILASSTMRSPGKSEDTLLPAIDALLGAAGRSKDAIRTLAVGVGPGGFTSLRVGIATAKGIAIGVDAALVGIGSLRTIARGACPAGGVVVVLQDARRGEVHAAVYAIDAMGSHALLEPMHGQAREVLAIAANVIAPRGVVPNAPIVVGDGARAYSELLAVLGEHRIAPEIYDRPRVDALVVEALEAIERGELATLDALEPHYVRPSDAKLPAVKLRTSLGD